MVADDDDDDDAVAEPISGLKVDVGFGATTCGGVEYEEGFNEDGPLLIDVVVVVGVALEDCCCTPPPPL